LWWTCRREQERGKRGRTGGADRVEKSERGIVQKNENSSPYRGWRLTFMLLLAVLRGKGERKLGSKGSKKEKQKQRKQEEYKSARRYKSDKDVGSTNLRKVGALQSQLFIHEVLFSLVLLILSY
jgi:hypothetical protein